MSPKETRYRRLLALYPDDFRREYAEEMLGVLMADPRPARSHVTNLVAGAAAARFQQTLGGAAWRRGALAVQLFGTILLCAVAARRVLMIVVAALTFPTYHVPPPDVLDVVRVVAWASAVVAALAGARGLGVTAALVGLGGEIAAPSRFYFDTPATFLHAYWIVVAAVVVLVASAVSARGPRPGGLLLVTAAGVVLVDNGYPLRLPMSPLAVLPLLGPVRLATVAVILPAAALTIAAVRRLDPEVRRRVVACAVPVVCVFPLVGGAFAGFVAFNGLHPASIRLLSPGQWAAMVVIPAAAFWVAAWLNMRLERSRRAEAALVVEPASPDEAAAL